MPMKCVILAGGLGTRISEESHLRPKPMIEIGGRPLLWHIMKIYARHGINEFIVCLGYRGYIIKEYFTNYFLHQSDVTIDTSTNKLTFHQSQVDDWKVTLVDTGEHSMTGGRLKRIGHHLNGNEPFCMTYGDGVSDVDIGKLIAFHRAHGKKATLTAVVPPGRYGALEIESDLVKRFQEKPPGDNAFINGGFFVLDPAVLDRIDNDETHWERAPLEGLARDRQLAAYRHLGFWHPMDTLRDKTMLEELWATKRAPWKVWD
jgi:glucose-1-phosphate cytidylyltransferase